MPTDDLVNPRIDHDELFKKLLTTFFVEFIELFLPELAAYLDRDSIAVPFLMRYS
jgi:hypothetical protein